MSYRQTSVGGLPALSLRSDLLELVVVPTAGMRITNLRRTRGREWLWRNPDIPLLPPRRGTSYVETADSGGWDECFPTIAPSAVPGADPPLDLPDHGELWQATWTATVYDHAQGTTLLASAEGERLPYEFTREITLLPHEPVVRVDYRLRHTGGAAFPWLWSAHPLLNVQPGSVVELGGVGEVRVGAVHGRADLAAGDMLSWPGDVAGDADRFVFPGPAGWAAKLFGDLRGEGRLSVTDPRRGERLEIRADPAVVPQVGVWINAGGWGPGETPYSNLALEPCIGAPDSLADAVERWQTAERLEPGAERIWRLEVALLEPDD